MIIYADLAFSWLKFVLIYFHLSEMPTVPKVSMQSNVNAQQEICRDSTKQSASEMLPF